MIKRVEFRPVNWVQLIQSGAEAVSSIGKVLIRSVVNGSC